ncbi:MAG: ATP-binding protein [Mariprofundaceae bacterium]|nr:ATP-binding protein [Mariprofundaceae bacterium]
MPPESIAASSIPLPMLMLDNEGFILSANMEAQSALGISERALTGRHASNLFAPESEIQVMLNHMKDNYGSLSSHGLCERSSNAPCSLHIGPAGDGYALLMVPEAGRHDLEQHVKRQEMAEAIARIALEMAHEVKNPLAALRGAAQWLSEQWPQGDQREAVMMMLGQVDLIRERIDSFLQLGPRAPIGMAYINIHSLIDDVCHPVDGVVVRRVFDPSLPLIQAHAGRLRQAIENLWMNALEAGAAHIEWLTRVNTAIKLPEHKGTVLEVRINNDGEPIPQHIQDHLFEPFVTAKTRGNGLGLALIQRVMQEHNGQVRLQSEAGRTSFILHLPIGKTL